jgi:hypothetical protein
MARPPRQRHDWSPPTSRTGFGGTFPGGAAGSGPGFGGGMPGSGPKEERGAEFLTLIRAWAAGIVVLVVTEYLQVTLIYEHLVGPRGTGSWGGTLLLVHLPNLVCVALATWAAARMHPEPQCRRPLRHAVAACAVPVAGQVLTLADEGHRPGFDALSVVMSTGVLITGCAIGWAAERWQRPEA